LTAIKAGKPANDAKSKVDTYLRNAAGVPVYAGASLNIGGFNFTNIGTTSFSSTSGFYNLAQEHTAQSLSLKSNTQGEWDWEAVASNMRFSLDTFRFPATALPAASMTLAVSV
jgi:iron complex outermembrane receptor protein